MTCFAFYPNLSRFDISRLFYTLLIVNAQPYVFTYLNIENIVKKEEPKKRGTLKTS